MLASASVPTSSEVAVVTATLVSCVFHLAYACASLLHLSLVCCFGRGHHICPRWELFLWSNPGCSLARWLWGWRWAPLGWRGWALANGADHTTTRGLGHWDGLAAAAGGGSTGRSHGEALCVGVALAESRRLDHNNPTLEPNYKHTTIDSQLHRTILWRSF